MKDSSLENMHGVDVDPDILDICRQCNVPGTFHQIETLGSLTFSDKHFDLIVAYSMFTHLSEHVHLH